MNKKNLGLLLSIVQGDFAWFAVAGFSFAQAYRMISLQTMAVGVGIYLPVAILCTWYFLSHIAFNDRAMFFRILGKYFFFPVPKRYKE